MWIYVSSPTHTESFKLYPFSKFQNKTDLVVADYDAKYFMAKSIKAYLVSSNGQRKLNASTYFVSNTSLEAKLGDKITSYNIGHIPSYNYNFDWCDFSFMYRHLINKDRSFEVGVTVPDSNSKSLIKILRFHFRLAVSRLRHVLLTTATTVPGVIPTDIVIDEISKIIKKQI